VVPPSLDDWKYMYAEVVLFLPAPLGENGMQVAPDESLYVVARKCGHSA
jgi:hypothetical protein